MKQILNKLITLERDVVAEKGPFLLFALFLREDAPNRWDFVVSAPWIEKDKMYSYRYFSDHLQSRLEREEVILLSRIVLIDENNPALEDIHEEFQVEHGLIKVYNREFFGLQMDRAYIITSAPLRTSTIAQSCELNLSFSS